MELRRHIDRWFEEWKEDPEHKPALEGDYTYCTLRNARIV